MKTFKGFEWKLGVKVTASGIQGLCTNGWLHGYEHPLLAIFHNPIHANYPHPRLFEAETTDEKPLRDGFLKLGVRNLTLIKEILVPEVSLEQKVAYGILCAKEVYPAATWQQWANDWLSRGGRSERLAAAALEATWASKEAGAAVAALWAAAEAAARAVEAATWASKEAGAAAKAAEEAAWAAEVALEATWAAAEAAARAVEAAERLNLITIAEIAINLFPK